MDYEHFTPAAQREELLGRLTAMEQQHFSAVTSLRLLGTIPENDPGKGQAMADEQAKALTAERAIVELRAMLAEMDSPTEA